MLGYIGQDQVGRDWCDLIESCLAEFALYVIFSGKPEPAVKLDTGVGRLPTGLGCEVLRHICLGTARLARVEQFASTVTHKVSCFDFDMCFGNGELYPLDFVRSGGQKLHDPLRIPRPC